MSPFDLPTGIVDRATHTRVVAHLRERGVALPRFAELAAPVREDPAGVDPDALDPRNLYRVHWYNRAMTVSGLRTPCHIELPQALTGVPARIVALLGRPFPIIHAHKVLAAYGCIAPRLVSGLFDPTSQRAVWPSTGNYCRGGVAISRMLGCRGVAVLPEGMSAERFAWLDAHVADPADIIRTPGTESNVKEIYDACAVLEKDPQAVILNQFSEFPNYLVHYLATGAAVCRVYEAHREAAPDLRLAAFVAATGSAGAIAAGDRAKHEHGARIVAVEPTECPTMLYNGFGEHNIQGVGDKHVPLIHNVMNTDIVAGVSDAATDDLDVLFNTEAGRRYLVGRKGVDPEIVGQLDALGFSGICNVLAAIRTARRLRLGPDDMLVTLATDGAELYDSERAGHLAGRYGGSFDEVDAAEAFGRHLLGGDSDHVLELGRRDRDRIFNLGYYTWVEQQGIAVEDFERRRDQRFWRGLLDLAPAFDEMIERTNRDAGFASAA